MTIGYIEWLNIILIISILLNVWTFCGWLEKQYISGKYKYLMWKWRKNARNG
tara:strand:- start:4367 stop:4522 length:156 start_codon:yes stop_codon:yes gene_type:complete